MTKKKRICLTLFSNQPKTLSLNILLNTIAQMNYLTVAELFEQYPEIKTLFKWKESDIQDFFECQLLNGKMDSGVLLIKRESIESLIDYRKNVGKGTL